MNLAIVIAAFNEEKSLGKVLSSLPKKLEGIDRIMPVVVDDGSGDRTAEIARKAGAIVVSHIMNRGQGAALKTGFDFALAQGADIVVTFDADGQHHAEDIPAMIRPILKGETEVVLGSRFLAKKPVNLSLARKFVLRGGVFFTRLISNIHVTDTHNGFRALHKNALRRMNLHQDKMEHASEILDQISHLKLPFKEVPVTISYSDYSKAKGQAHSNALAIAFKMVVYKLAR